MTQPQQQERNCRLIDQNDLINFLKFAGFDIELAKCTDGTDDITVSGFDDTGDIWCISSRPAPSQGTFTVNKEQFNQMIKDAQEQAAAKARADVLDDITKFICAYEDFIGLDNIDGFEIYGVKSVNLKEHIESLRHQEP